MTRRTARLTAICLLALTLIGSSWAAWGQYQSATGNVVGTVGGACNSSSITYGWPDTNGDILKCVSNVWTLVTMPATAGGSNGQVQFNSSNVLAGSANLFWDNTNSRRGIGTTAPATNLEVAGALRLSTSTTDTFTTPQSSSISTKINIPLYNPGAFGQLIAMGLPTGAASTARAITMVDARGSAHQPTLSVLSPDDTNIFGLTSEGSNSSFYLKSTNQLGLLVSGTTEGMHIDGSGNITTHGTVATGGAVTISATSPVTGLSVVNDGAQIGSGEFIAFNNTISPYTSKSGHNGDVIAMMYYRDEASLASDESGTVCNGSATTPFLDGSPSGDGKGDGNRSPTQR